eukprot:14243497-Ditylum_brightwellii.AAC.1
MANVGRSLNGRWTENGRGAAVNRGRWCNKGDIARRFVRLAVPYPSGILGVQRGAGRRGQHKIPSAEVRMIVTKKRARRATGGGSWHASRCGNRSTKTCP